MQSEYRKALRAQSEALVAMTAMFELAARDQQGRPNQLIDSSSVILGKQLDRVINAAIKVERGHGKFFN